MPFIEGTGVYGPYFAVGAPTAGVDEIQILTIGGTPTGATFRLAFDGYLSSAISWSSTNTTLIANVDGALEALPPIGTGGIATASVALTAGVGTISLTFSGARLAKREHALITAPAAHNLMTGTAPTVAVTASTEGVRATLRNAPTGAIYVDTTASSGKIYMNTAAAGAPTWTAQT